MTELSTSRGYRPPPERHGLRDELARAGAAVRHAVGPADGSGWGDDRRRLDHDVLHELSTIMLLASLVNESADVGVESRRRARQIMTETRWLENLVRCYRDQVPVDGTPERKAVRVIRLDLLVESVLKTARLQVSTRVSVDSTPVHVRVDRVAFGRALRNLIWNGLEAAGPAGELSIRVATLDDAAIVDVEDDGPGYDPSRAEGAHLGLEIVRQIVGSRGGELEIGAGAAGGCRMRLILPIARREQRAISRSATATKAAMTRQPSLPQPEEPMAAVRTKVAIVCIEPSRSSTDDRAAEPSTARPSLTSLQCSAAGPGLAVVGDEMD